MKTTPLFTGLALLLVQQQAMAVASIPLPAAPLSAAGLPVELGGMTALAAVTLIIGAQLIKRRK